MPTIAAAGPRPLRPGRNLCPHRPLLHAEIVIRLRHNRSAGGKLPAGSKCQESSNLCRRPSVLLSPSRRSCRFAADGSGCQWRRPGRQLKAVGSLLSRLVVGRHQRRASGRSVVVSAGNNVAARMVACSGINHASPLRPPARVELMNVGSTVSNSAAITTAGALGRRKR